jgi:SAM-dependent methyltransferase
MTSEETAKLPSRLAYYEDYWQSGQIRPSPHLAYKVNLTRNDPRVLRARSILDVGCGDGYILDHLEKRDHRLCGVDVSPDGVAKAAAKGFDARVVDLENEPLPFASGSFDVVLCYDVLEHLFSPERVLSEIYRVVSPGGFALLGVPNTLNLFNRLAFLRGDYVDVTDTSHRSGELFSNHIRLFSRRLFERFLRLEPFEIRAKHFYFPDEFSDGRFPLPKNLAAAFKATRIPELLPDLFALGFFYACEKPSAVDAAPEKRT